MGGVILQFRKTHLLVECRIDGVVRARWRFRVLFKRNLDRVTMLFRGDELPTGTEKRSRYHRLTVDPNISRESFELAFRLMFSERTKWNVNQLGLVWDDPDELPNGWRNNV